MDELFRKYGAKYGIPWALLKAQGIAESGLNPNAVSPKGAYGIMQLLPKTFAEIQQMLPHIKNIMNSEENIEAGAFYMRRIIKMIVRFNPHPKDVIPLALAAYNWGIGNLTRLIKRIGTSSWTKIYEYLPEETKRYVKRIFWLYLKNSGNII